MPETTLAELLEKNAQHTDSLDPDHFGAVQEGQDPAAVSICCSDSRVSQEGMWNVTEPGWLFTPSTIGNQVWDRQDGDLVVDGSLHYPIAAGTDVALVVGHTGCGAVTAALEAVRDGSADHPPGIEKWVDLLAPVVADGLLDDRIDAGRDVSLVDQLVEYNVDRQVEFLLDSDVLPEGGSVYGFVYDFQGTYGDVDGRTYLVNADGETDVSRLRDLVGASRTEFVERLL